MYAIVDILQYSKAE